MRDIRDEERRVVATSEMHTYVQVSHQGQGSHGIVMTRGAKEAGFYPSIKHGGARGGSWCFKTRGCP